MDLIYSEPGSVMGKLLTEELSKRLKEITGDTGKSSYSPEEFNCKTDVFLIIKENGTPIACGSIRIIDSSVCEMKRVYSKKKGFGKIVVENLEERARQLGYRKVILSTRKVNCGAVEFYKKLNYEEMESYGKYRFSDLSICLGKFLTGS